MTFQNFFTPPPAGSTPPGGMRPTLTPPEVGLTAAVVALGFSGAFSDLDRRCISLMRDQFPPLSDLDDTTFDRFVEEAANRVRSGNYGSDIPSLVSGTVLPVLPNTSDRIGLYKYIYTLAMSDLNINDQEGALLQALRQQGQIDPASFDAAEGDVANEYGMLFRALSAAALGLMVVTADGKVQPGELEDIKESRNMLDPIARLDDIQFDLVYDLGLNIHDRYLLDLNNRSDFLANVIGALLQDQNIRMQAFQYAAHVATADSDISQAEVDMLKQLLGALSIDPVTGEQILNGFMSRVKTIDGKPIGT